MRRKSCNFCVKRRIRCNKQQPCDNCQRLNKTCVFPDSDVKRRPVSGPHAEALRGQIASLTNFISELIAADTNKRNEMLAAFQCDLSSNSIHSTSSNPQNGRLDSGSDAAASSPEGGRHYNVQPAYPGIFLGPTASEIPILGSEASLSSWESNDQKHAEASSIISDVNSTIFDPHGWYCRNSIRLFFDEVYTSHMCLYREYFLRDYDNGGGPYYSEILMNAICSLGGLLGTEEQRGLSENFARRCEEILFGGEFERTRLTTLQALLLMGTRAIGRGQHSKGWQFTRMAFGMIYEMGLYYDPVHWKVAVESEVELEIYRRVYWAAFVLDKQLSLSYGRPPMIEPNEADVKATIRIPYPSGWATLLQKYIKRDVTPETYERGEELIQAFVQKVELCRIIHEMLRGVFARANSMLAPTVLEALRSHIHGKLEQWHASLPENVRWTKSTKCKVPSYTIQLHMLFHTAVMVLRRPKAPQNLIEIPPEYKDCLGTCHESMEAVVNLIKTIKKDFTYLPVHFTHTAAAAASILLAERQLGPGSYDQAECEEHLNLLTDALDGVSKIWTASTVVRDTIISLISQQSVGEPLGCSFDYEFLIWLQDNGMAADSSTNGSESMSSAAHEWKELLDYTKLG